MLALPRAVWRTARVFGLGLAAITLLAIIVLTQGSGRASAFTQIVAVPSAQPSPAAPRAPVTSNSAAPAQCTQDNGAYLCTLSSRAGWQQIPRDLSSGDLITITYIAGSWTVDMRAWPPVRPEGYAPEIDGQIGSEQVCKVLTDAPYAKLLGQIGNGAPFEVGRGGTFRADGAGRVSLMINDRPECQSDNEGAVVMQIQVQRAPSCAQLSFDPPSVEILLNKDRTTALRIANAANLYGADVTIKFDPNIVQVVPPIATGTLFGGLDHLVVKNQVDNSAGIATFAITLRAPSAPINGSGALLAITWRGAHQGTSKLTLTGVDLSDSDGHRLCNSVQTGEARVLHDETITGRVLLQGAQDHSGTNVFLTDDPHACDGKLCVQQLSRVPLTITDQNGRFGLSPDPALRYACLWTYHACYLTGVKRWPSGEIGTLTLPAGDVNEDNCIDIRDLTKMASTCLGTHNCPCADFNQDGKTDISDLVIIAQNLGRCGSVDDWQR